jgi:hypothetical protein
MSSWGKELGPVANKLDDKDRALFVSYVARMRAAAASAGGGTPVPPGTTVGQAIEDQKRWAAEAERLVAKEKEERARKEAEAAARKARLDAERAAAVAKIKAAVVVTLLGKRELPRDMDAGRSSPMQEVTLVLENKSAKAIAAVAGTMEFIDPAGKVVARMHVEVSDVIHPGDTYRWIGERAYDDFVDEQRALWKLQQGKYQTRFMPSSLAFVDGEKVKPPE